MGAGIHGGFGNTKGYREAVALNAVLIGSNGDLLKKYASRYHISINNSYSFRIKNDENLVRIFKAYIILILYIYNIYYIYIN